MTESFSTLNLGWSVCEKLNSFIPKFLRKDITSRKKASKNGIYTSIYSLIFDPIKTSLLTLNEY